MKRPTTALFLFGFLTAPASAAGSSSLLDKLKTATHGNTAPAQVSGMSAAFEKVGSASKLSFLQNVHKNGINAVELFESALEGGALKPLLDNVEVQHRILEEIPVLAAVPGFKKITGRRLGDAETAAGFVEGIKSLIDLSKNMDTKVKDPNYALGLVADLKKSDDPETQELFRLASMNDITAIRKIQDKVAEKLFPGVDLDTLRSVRDKMSFDKLTSLPELAAFIDVDDQISQVLRTNVKQQ